MRKLFHLYIQLFEQVVEILVLVLEVLVVNFFRRKMGDEAGQKALRVFAKSFNYVEGDAQGRMILPQKLKAGSWKPRNQAKPRQGFLRPLLRKPFRGRKSA